jgi:hypothetical protein
MSKTKRLADLQQEQESIASKETQSVVKESRVFVKPELYKSVFEYLHNSIPKNNTVQEIVTLITELQRTSVQGDATFHAKV